MPYPGKTVARNSSYDGRWKDIDEDFVDMMKELFPIILSPANLTVKTINGVAVKAFEASVYLKDYVDLFSAENMPEAKNIYETTLDKQFQILISKCVEIYLESISQYQEQIRNKTEVEQLHTISKSIALRYFDEEKKFGSSNDSQVYLEELNDKLEKAFNEWKPVTLEFLEKIKNEQSKAEEQHNVANEARVRDQKAKEESADADKKYIDLQKKINQTRTDTAEQRREAEDLRKRLAKAEREREQAYLRESQTRQYFELMKQKADEYERLLMIERQRNAQRVQKKVQGVRQQYGILQWIGGGFVGFFNAIGNAFTKLFYPSSA
jgi:chromosome segregation ATPase